MTTAVEAELVLLEAEVAVRAELTTTDVLPRRASRLPLPHEVRAGVKFAAIDRLIDDAAGVTARHAATVRGHVVDGLAEELAGLLAVEDPWEAVKALGLIADPTRPDTIPDLRQAVDDATQAITRDLLTTATAAADEARAEAGRQGLTDLPGVDPAVDPAVRSAVEASAQRVARHPVERVMGAAVEAASRAAAAVDASGADVILAAIDAAEAASTAGTEDLAQQAAGTAHGLGRAGFAAAAPTPREVYASELLDRNTCRPCGSVDGRTYATLEDALVDYPGAGGFIGCEGGGRCRGSLVYVWDTESAPTRDAPPGQSGPSVPDRTPRGPASNAPAPITGPALEPAAGASTIDDTGRTTPIEREAPVPAPVLPDSPSAPVRDLDLEQIRTTDLDARLRAASAAGDHAEATRIADELDRRDFGTSGYVDPDSQDWGRRWAASGDLDDLPGDAVDYAHLEAQLAQEFEDTAGLSEALNDATPGRRIDRVRDAWDDELTRAATDAENATNGYLIDRDKLEEFRRTYGPSTTQSGAVRNTTDLLFTGPARIGYYYASEELRAYWAVHPRLTFAEFAVQSGIRDAKTLARARKAAEARNDAAARAEESIEGKARRKAQADTARRQRRGPLSEGERFRQAQARAERERRRAEKLQREAGGDT